VAARLDVREVLSQFPVLSISYLPNNLLLFVLLLCIMFIDFTNTDFENGRNIPFFLVYLFFCFVFFLLGVRSFLLPLPLYLHKHTFFTKLYRLTQMGHSCIEMNLQGPRGHRGPVPPIEMLFHIFRLNFIGNLSKMLYFSNKFSKIANR